MARYRKKPVEVEAWQVGSDEPMPEWLKSAMDDGTAKPYRSGHWWVIKTLEGDHRANAGDYIIQGVKGELYPCKPDIFEQTYEADMRGSDAWNARHERTCHDEEQDDEHCFKCSLCGYEYSAVGNFGCEFGDDPDFAYCPNCGAKVVRS